MNAYLKKSLVLGIFVLFASTVLSAAPILINAESGTARSVNGAWGLGCESAGQSLPDENRVLVFEQAFLFFVREQLFTYTSTDGTCSTGGKITSISSRQITSREDFVTLGWLDEFENPVPPPLRLDGSGSLNPNPTVTKLGTEPFFFYMDDTAEPYCIYRDADSDTNYLSTFERRCKVDPLPFPLCDIQLNKTNFAEGDTVTAKTLLLANRGGAPVATEIKMWLGVPGMSPISIVNVGADGSVVLQAGENFFLGPADALHVTDDMPHGSYELGCRMIDPVTGEIITEDRNSFVISEYATGGTGPAGGIVFYTTADGLHGLEAAPTALASAPWGCSGTPISGADGTAIGTGAQNTADILAGCAEPGTAAALADAYSLNNFTDWYLPSSGELHLMKWDVNPELEFSGDYWSSSELTPELADTVILSPCCGIPNPFLDRKEFSFGVWPIRTF